MPASKITINLYSGAITLKKLKLPKVYRRPQLRIRIRTRHVTDFYDQSKIVCGDETVA